MVRFSLRRLRFSLRTHTSDVLLYSDTTARTRANGCIEKIQPQRMHAACRIVTRGSCVPSALRSSTATNCESCCSLEQLVASLCAAHEGKPASGTYHSKTEGYIRRNLYRPPGLLYCGECTWTRTSRQPVTAITWHVTQHTLLEPLTVTGARALCFGERYRDVLSKNFDENNSTHTSTDC